MRRYRASASFSTTGNKTLLLLEAPASKLLVVDSVRVGNTSLTTNERWQIAVTRVTTKGTPAGTSVTPTKLDSGDPASSAIVLSNLTTEPTAYDTVHLVLSGDSNQLGMRWLAVPGAEIVIPPSGLIGVRLLATITATSVTVDIGYGELG